MIESIALGAVSSAISWAVCWLIYSNELRHSDARIDILLERIRELDERVAATTRDRDELRRKLDSISRVADGDPAVLWSRLGRIDDDREPQEGKP